MFCQFSPSGDWGCLKKCQTSALSESNTQHNLFMFCYDLKDKKGFCKDLYKFAEVPCRLCFVWRCKQSVRFISGDFFQYLCLFFLPMILIGIQSENMNVEEIWEERSFRKTFTPWSLYVSHAVSKFYWTEIETWAGFRPVGSTEKKLGPIMSNFWGQFFMFSWAKKCLKSKAVSTWGLD